jgi:Flp pilus assembly protein TadD
MLPAGTKTITATALLLLLSAVVVPTRATAADEEVCDVTADFALGREDYSTALVLHRKLLSSHPNDALAHYHLGFAYGMVGRDAEEISEYLWAAKLGLHRWDLFLNLGLAYLEQHQLSNATAALETAVFLGPEHPETHFNLATVYERERRLADALREIRTSRHLAPEDHDVANTNAIICAETGDLVCARDLWTHLVQAAPDYTPARSNLVILRQWSTRFGQSKQYPQLTYTQPGIPASHAADNQLFARQAKHSR